MRLSQLEPSETSLSMFEKALQNYVSLNFSSAGWPLMSNLFIRGILKANCATDPLEAAAVVLTYFSDE